MCNFILLFLVCSKSQGIPPVKKEGEKKEEQANSVEGKGIASRIIGPFKPVRTREGRGNFSMTYDRSALDVLQSLAHDSDLVTCGPVLDKLLISQDDS